MKTTTVVVWAARATFLTAGLIAPIALVLGQPRWEQAVQLVCLVLWSALVSSYAAQVAELRERWKGAHLDWVGGYVAALNDLSAPSLPPDPGDLP